MGEELPKYQPPIDTLPQLLDNYHKPKRFTGHIPGYTANRDWKEYDADLPSWENLTYTQLVERKILQKGEVNILDIGCGLGNGLRLPKHLASRSKRYGITLIDYRPTPERLRDELIGIQITDGDAHNLTDYYPRDTFDLVISSFALYYVNQLIVVPKIIEVMGPEAIALLQGASRSVIESQPSIKISLVRNGISFQKPSGL